MINWLCVYKLGVHVTASLIMPQTFMATERLATENINWKGAKFACPPKPVLREQTPQGGIIFEVKY